MTGDLYELFDDTAGWRMPILVTWINEANAEVSISPIPLLKIQRQAVEDLLTEVATHRDGDKWFIAVVPLNEIADKSEETDPEQVVKWKYPEPPATVPRDFVHAYCCQKYAVIKSPAQFGPIWDSIRKFMLQWLVAEGRSVDLHWGRLDAFPVRANWKNAILGRMFTTKTNKHYKQHRLLYAEEHYNFMRRSIHHENMTAYDIESGTMRWSCEFTPTKRFHSAAEAREKERKARPHKTNWFYKNNYLGQVMKIYRTPEINQRLYANLVAYAKETNYPIAVFPGRCYVQRPPKGQQPTRTTTRWYKTPVVTLQAATAGTANEFPGQVAVAAENEGVQSVQDLRPDAQDVRNAGGNVAAAGEGDDGDAWMSMLASTEE